MTRRRKPKKERKQNPRRQVDTRIPGAKSATVDRYTGNPVLDPLGLMSQARQHGRATAGWYGSW
jgi:hypothetical protein